MSNKRKNTKIEDENIHEEFVERDKRLIMWTGVTFFMVLILFVWITNTKKIFNTISTNEDVEEFNWDEIRKGFDETMNDFKEGMEELNNLDQQATTTSEELNSTEDIAELKARLEELEMKLEDNGQD